MAELQLIDLGMLLVVTSLVAMMSRRIGLPYTAGLVAAGIVLALLPIGVNLPLSRELVFNIFLPPLIFEAALQMPWQRLRAQIVELDPKHELTSSQEFAALDAAAMGLAEVITVAKNGKLSMEQAQQGRQAALEVSAKVRALVRAARTRRHDG